MNALLAVSKGICAVKLHFNKIIQFFLRVLSNGGCLEGKRENYQLCSVLSNIVRHSCAQCNAHTYMNRPNSSLDLVLSHWAHFTVLRFIFVYVLLHACVEV